MASESLAHGSPWSLAGCSHGAEKWLMSSQGHSSLWKILEREELCCNCKSQMPNILKKFNLWKTGQSQLRSLGKLERVLLEYLSGDLKKMMGQRSGFTGSCLINAIPFCGKVIC